MDSIISHNYFSKSILSDEIGLIGFSAGGFSSLILLGAVPDFESCQEFSPYLANIKELSFEELHDNRIKASCLYAPALSHLFKKESLEKIAVPVLMINAKDDEVLGGSVNQYRTSLPHIIEEIVLENCGHYIFNSDVSELMKKLAYEKYRDTDDVRKKSHLVIVDETLIFLNNCLK